MDTKDGSAWKRELLPLFSEKLRSALERLDERRAMALEEIRVRAMKPMLLLAPDGFFIDENGEPTDIPDRAVSANLSDCAKLLSGISQHSLYALEQEMRSGYISLAGGYRVGFCGKAVLNEGRVKHFTNPTSFCVRIAREQIGRADKAMPYMLGASDELFSTLVLSPPRCGKTTIIRDIARQLSYGGLHRARQVVIVDERSEIAGSCRGVPQNDVGPRTDVLDACPKAEGMRIALRAMSPDVLVTDEIGSEQDRQCILDAAGAGVAVIASAHASSIQDAMRRSVLRSLITQGLFERVLLLGRSEGAGTLEDVLDGATLSSLLPGAKVIRAV